MTATTERLRLLHRLGFEPAEARGLLLVPLVEVAWADGTIQQEEAQVLARAAGEWAVGEDGHRMLANWLEFAPTPGYRDAALGLLAGTADAGRLNEAARAVAQAAGGWLGRITRAERQALRRIDAALSGHAEAAEPEPDLRKASPVVTLAVEGDELEIEPQGAVLVPDFDSSRRVAVPYRGLLLGSAGHADVQVTGDPEIAPAHCSIVRMGAGRYLVRDLARSTRVNGERVRERRLLGGETVRLSEATSFLFKRVRRVPARLLG